MAVLTASPALAILLLGGFVSSTREGCPLIWAVPAMVLAVLFPGSTLAFLPLTTVLFWPLLAGREAWSARLCGGVFASAWLWHQDAPMLLPLGGLLMVLIIGSLAHSWFRGLAIRDVCALRPLLLLVVTLAARAAGLQATAQAGAFAFFLDLCMQAVLPLVRPFFGAVSVLRFPVLPLSGFMVLWLGIHAALGLAAGAQEWSVAGMVVAMLLAALALVDVAVVLSSRAQETRRWPVGTMVLGSVGAVVLVPLLVMAVCSPAIARISGAWMWAILSFSGGDGAHLRVAAFCGLILLIWVMLVRPWTPQGVRALESVRGWGHGTQAQVLLPGEGFSLPWVGLRILAAIRRVWRHLGALRLGQLPDIREAGVWLWLVLLGLVLAFVGLAG